MKVIAVTYLIVALPTFLFFLKDRKPDYFYANSFVFGVFSVLWATFKLWETVFMINKGYFQEIHAFHSRNIGVWWYLEMGLMIVAIILPMFNLKRSNRQNFTLQSLILTIYSGYIIIDFIINGLYPYSIVPGSQAIMPLDLFVGTYIFMFILVLIANFLLLKFKWLPEFQEDEVDIL
jgi:hypothetical protein